MGSVTVLPTIAAGTIPTLAVNTLNTANTVNRTQLAVSNVVPVATNALSTVNFGIGNNPTSITTVTKK
jgi:hypothetical protein